MRILQLLKVINQWRKTHGLAYGSSQIEKQKPSLLLSGHHHDSYRGDIPKILKFLL